MNNHLQITLKLHHIGEYLVRNQIKINISKEHMITAYVEMVTINGRPFSALDDSGFQKIVDPIFDN